MQLEKRPKKMRPEGKNENEEEKKKKRGGSVRFDIRDGMKMTLYKSDYI